MKTIVKKSFPLFLLIPLLINACNASEPATPTPRPTTAPPAAIATVQVVPTLPPAAVSPTETVPEPTVKTYENSDFGLKFDYPLNWFGPTEYVSEQVLRLEIGSDVVYPYGTDPTMRVYELKNSYTVLIQYSKNDQNSYWKEAFESLDDLGDGESLSTARSQLIKLRNLEFGRFQGIEYISTLSETAQTEAVYSRNVILFDDQSNVLTLMGQPNNVLLGDGLDWRSEYQRIDEANVVLFHEILDSIAVE